MRVLVGLVTGYGLGAALGAVLVDALSANTHDKSVEIAMTAAFVTGPIGAIIGTLAALIWPRRASKAPADTRDRFKTEL